MTIELKTYRDFSLPALLPRRVDVWVPPQYHQELDRHFPVLYMHDGQNLFHRHKFILRTWKVTETINRLVEEGSIPPVIVVGIWNTSNRLGDYLPQKPMAFPKYQAELKRITAEYKFAIGDQVADTYLQLITEKIKPRIDEDFRTLPNFEHTGIMGSSMGGLISLYALTEYPDVFGLAGCISTHWPICLDAMIPYLEEKLPVPGRHKLYFDHGTRGLDADYGPYQHKVNEILRAKGYREGIDWMTKIFEGHDHNEVAWSSRLEIPLRFLFG